MQLIDDLLDVSRIVAGKLTLDCHPVDLRAPVRAALDNVAPLLNAKSLMLGCRSILRSPRSGPTACACSRWCRTCSPTRPSSRRPADTDGGHGTRRASRACA